MSSRSSSSSKTEKAAPTAEQADKAKDQAPQTGRPEDSGPGTGREAPKDETAGRYPSTVVNSDSAPLDPPADTHTQAEPEQGYSLSSTDHVYAETGGRTIAGEDHVGLVGDDDKSVSESNLFEEEDGKTFVTVKTRVYEEFYYPNTTEKAKRLLFTEGQRVPRGQAERIKAAMKSAPKPGQNRTGAAPDSAFKG